MPRDYLAESKRRLVEVCALLTAWADDLKPSDGDAHAFSRVVIAREAARAALEGLDELERPSATRQPPPD